MGYYHPDIYNQPEAFGLTLLGEVNWYDLAYEFDFSIVLVDKDGFFYLERDSGCSCPSPFEGYTNLEELSKMTRSEVIAELQDTLSNVLGDRDSTYNYVSPQVEQDVARVIEKINGHRS